MLKQWPSLAVRSSVRPFHISHAITTRIASTTYNLRMPGASKPHIPCHTSRPTLFARNYGSRAEKSEVTGKAPATVSFELADEDGSKTRIHIRPSYPNKPKAIENLLKSLPPLLTGATMPVSAIKSFTTPGWDLDEGNDTIHRYAELKSGQDISDLLEQIDAAAQDLNHDPHVYANGTKLTISCTTHVPAGLSMKDVKLATRINEILADADAKITQDGWEEEAEILTQRQRGREQNMEAVRKAKLNCGCE